LQSLPDGLKNCAITLLGQQQFDLQRMQQDIRVALQAKWGEQLPAIWEQLASYFRRPGPNPVKLPSATAAETVVRNSPTSPLELDQAMLHNGEASQRSQEISSSATLQLDSMGFVQGVTGLASIDKVGHKQIPRAWEQTQVVIHASTTDVCCLQRRAHPD
jgi:hypothetical protein